MFKVVSLITCLVLSLIIYVASVISQTSFIISSGIILTLLTVSIVGIWRDKRRALYQQNVQMTLLRQVYENTHYDDDGKIFRKALEAQARNINRQISELNALAQRFNLNQEQRLQKKKLETSVKKQKLALDAMRSVAMQIDVRSIDSHETVDGFISSTGQNGTIVQMRS